MILLSHKIHIESYIKRIQINNYDYKVIDRSESNHFKLFRIKEIDPKQLSSLSFFFERNFRKWKEYKIYVNVSPIPFPSNIPRHEKQYRYRRLTLRN